MSQQSVQQIGQGTQEGGQGTREWPGALPERGIYAACLASYNSGMLHGCWIDVEGKDADDIQSEIAAMLEASPEPGAEEWAIHDYAGIPSSFGEYPDLKKIVQWVEMSEQHGEAWAAYVDAAGEHYATPEGFSDAFLGEYDSAEDYAAELYEGYLADLPDNIKYCMDWGQVVQCLDCNDGIIFAERGGSCFVFSNC
jgi:antirestriction protein